MIWGFGWGLTSCACAYAFYLLSQESLREAEYLKSVSKIKKLKHLAQLLDTASGLLASVVTISGRAGSDTPIACKYSDLRGVIVEERVSQEYLEKDDDRWKKKSKLMSSTAKEVPWYLDDGTGRVHIKGARDAKGLVLTSSGEVFEKSGPSPAGSTLDKFFRALDLQTLQVLGVKRRESVLPTGTSLTVVGQAVKDNTGTIRIQKPREGPFYVSRRSIDGLIQDAREWAGLHKYACVGFLVVGGCLIAMNVIHYIRKMVLRRRVRGALRQMEQHNEDSRRTAQDRENNSNRHRLMPDGPRLLENVGSDRTTLSGEDNSNRDHLMEDDSSLCVICLQQEYNTVFVPCGHLCCCMTCSSPLTSCPLCRRRISKVVRTFRR